MAEVLYTYMMNEYISVGKTTLRYMEKSYPIAIGTNGLNNHKQEGDETTPTGVFPLGRLFYREDRLSLPHTTLSVIPIQHNYGWCDDVTCAQYNTLIVLPHSGNYEQLYRDDEIYDVCIELGYNNNPVVQGLGSAIFIHIAREGLPPTRGCVALAKEDLLEFISQISPTDLVRIDSECDGR